MTCLMTPQPQTYLNVFKALFGAEISDDKIIIGHFTIAFIPSCGCKGGYKINIKDDQGTENGNIFPKPMTFEEVICLLALADIMPKAEA